MKRNLPPPIKSTRDYHAPAAASQTPAASAQPKKSWYSWMFKTGGATSSGPGTQEKKAVAQAHVQVPDAKAPVESMSGLLKKSEEEKGKVVQSTQGAKADAKPQSPQPSPKSTTQALPAKKQGFFARFARPKQSVTAKAAISGKPEDATQAAEEIATKMRASPFAKKKRRKLQRKSFAEYLAKAGFEVNPQRLRSNALYTVLAIFGLITLVVLVQAIRNKAQIADVLLFFAGLWLVVLPSFLLLLLGVTYFFLDYRIYRRTRELEEVLPDFLQLASANIAAGMPIDRALWYSIRPNFGVLAKEMEEVAKATMSGESLEKSLTQFADKFESVILKRSVSILIEGLQSGGELADLLDKIAVNIQEMKIMRKELAANVTTYAIFIIVACVAVAPMLFALATQLLIIITQITGSIDLSSSQSLFAISAVDPQIIKNFKIFSYLMLLISTVCGGAIVSVIQKGNVLEGVKIMPIYALIAFIIYSISLAVLGSLFGSII